ncbi:MAG: hypothetical protein ACD_22C00083G0001 [uncultured bacterium]|nr:MAG: hypothetical protein ACD_22C00083G0001 [uncultured bacterium]
MSNKNSYVDTIVGDNKPHFSWLEYASLLLSAVLALVASIITPGGIYPSDHIARVLGGLTGGFLFTSIFTLPLQFAEGWNKNKFIRKTIIGMPILLIVSLVSRLLNQ